jgi:hypothetical protein
MTSHELLGKRLARLKTSGRSDGTKQRATGGSEAVGNPPCQRELRADNRKINTFLGRQRQDCIGVADIHWDTASANTRVSRRADDLIDARFVGKLPGEDVFSRATTDEKQFHRRISCANRVLQAIRTDFPRTEA